MNKQSKRYILIIASFVLVGMGLAFSIKANIGVGAWDATAKTINEILHIELGTVGMMLNCSCVIGQIIVLRSRFKWIQLLQIPLSILLGTVVNFFLYRVLLFPFDHFYLGIVMYIVGLVMNAFGVAIVMLLDEVTFALEGFCMALSKVLPYPFHVIKQMQDVLCIVLATLMSYVLHLPYAVGTGTVIGMLLFGPMLGIFMKVMKPVLKKRGLLNYE